MHIMTDENATTAPHEADNAAPARFASFEEFYPFYLSEHQNVISRRLHIIGTGLVCFCLLNVVLWGLIGGLKFLIAAPIVGYGFAWVGHFFFEKNKPATFTYPAWSLLGDFRMFGETITGKRPF
jgi:hypothetical protein